MMSVCREQFYAEAVNRSEKCAVERFDHFQWQTRRENFLPRALLYFVSRSVCVGDDNQVRQPLACMSILCDRDNAVRNRARFARAGGSDYRKIPLQVAREALP